MGKLKIGLDFGYGNQAPNLAFWFQIASASASDWSGFGLRSIGSRYSYMQYILMMNKID